MDRLQRLWWSLLAVSLAVNAYVELSAGVADWFAKESSPRTTSLPAPVGEVLESRPQTSNADVHLALWFLAGLLACAATRTGRARRVALAGVFAYSAGLEALQGLSDTRTAQWRDVAGNVLGILAAWALFTVVQSVRLRRAQRPSPAR